MGAFSIFSKRGLWVFGGILAWLSGLPTASQAGYDTAFYLSANSYSAAEGGTISGTAYRYAFFVIGGTGNYNIATSYSTALGIYGTGHTYPIPCADLGGSWSNCRLTINFPAGSASVPFTIPFNNDASVEHDRTTLLQFVVNYSDPSHPQTAVVTELDNDDQVGVGIVSGGTVYSSSTILAGGTGGANTATIRFFRQNTLEAREIHYSLSGNASQGSDYSPSIGTVTIPNGADHTDVSISANNGSQTTEKTLGISITGGDYQIGAASSATVTILPDYPTVSIIGNDMNIAEGGGAGSFTIYRNPTYAASGAKTVSFSTNGAAIRGVNYTLAGNQITLNSITIPAGTSSTVITVTPIDDHVPSTNKSLTLTLQGGNYSIDGAAGSVSMTILDTDPLVNIVATDPTASESGESGLFTISRVVSDMSLPTTVYFTVSGTATNGIDYAFLQNSATIPAGSSYTTVTVAPRGNILTSAPATVTLSLWATNLYTLGASSNATVTVSNYDDTTRPLPNNTFALAPNARTGWFTRGTELFPAFWSFVIPVDLQKGVPLDNLGGVASNLFSPNPWTTTLYHIDWTNYPSPATFSFQNPIAAFGSRVGGSPLYFDQPYTFGVYAGNPSPSFTNAASYTNALRIQVFQRETMAYVGTITIPIPNSASTNEWTAFLTNGYTKTVSAFGLTTVLTFNQPQDVPWDALPDAAVNDVAYHLIHTATQSATNLVYEVELSGGSDFGWMVTDAIGNRGWSRLYTIEFERRPPWRAIVADRPTFQAVPMPSSYLGMSPDELALYSAPVTNIVSLANPSSYTNLDQSPELRRHPILDQFVADMGKDPLLLANYVINEIELTDALDYSDSGAVDEVAINPGGVSRSAFGTFLEKQGSPVEQCALMIYLLRQAGVPAVYVFPPHNGLLMTDTRLSTLLRMQIRGALRRNGSAYTTNGLIPVNYPWVAAYIGTKWVHIFPWLKDTEVTEGFDLHDYLPAPYITPYKWCRDYLFGATNILNINVEDDTPLTLYPLWLKKTLNESSPGMSLDDFGLHFRNRPQNRSRWADLPAPTYVTNFSIAVDTLSSWGITNVNPALTNIFDTISVEVKSLVNTNISVKSGELKLAELNDRRFLIRHEKVDASNTRLILSLAPFRTNVTIAKSFSSVNLDFPANTNALNYLISSNTLGLTDDLLEVNVVHKWHRSLPSGFSVPDVDDAYLGLQSGNIISDVLNIRKGDFAAICLNMGRVTKDMLALHAKDVWQMEQTIAQNPSLTNSLSPDLYQGSVLYLMGMSYFQKNDEFRQFVGPLHKANVLRFHEVGLSELVAERNPDGTLPNGNVNPVQPKVDMLDKQMVIVGNGNYHLESGDDTYNQVDRLFHLLITAASAEEHGILNTFFKQSDSVSTVKLLRLALTQTTNGILELNRYNYLTEGEKIYPAGSATKLKDASSSVWSTITNLFNTAYVSNNVAVLITPGQIRNSKGSYQGVGAMIFSPGQYYALIGPNNLNGGSGEYFNRYGALTPGDLWAERLEQNRNGDLSYDLDPPTTSAPALVPSTEPDWDAAARYAAIASGALTFDPFQAAALSIYSRVMGDVPNQQYTWDSDNQNTGALLQQVKPIGSESVLDPVNSIIGDFYVDDVDLELPGPFPLQIRRNYSSQNVFDGDLGYGWKFCYCPYLAIGETNKTINCAEADGTVITYRRDASNTKLYTPQVKDNRRIQNNAGSIANLLNGKITNSIVSGVTNYTMVAPDGSRRIFKVRSFPISNLNRVRPYLDTWSDNRGNFLRFSYGTNSVYNDYGQVNRIEANNGNFLSLKYDMYGHVTDVFTGDGRHVQYEYDNYGDLVKIVRPDASELEFEYEHLRYTSGGLTGYYSTHLLVQELKAEGRILRNEYDSQRRVTAQSATVGYDLRLVPNAFFVYSNNFSLTNYWTNGITGFTLVKDCYTNITRYEYTNSLMRRIIDPIGRTNLMDWYATNDVSPGAYPNGLKSTTDPRGLLTTRYYNAQGNLTNITVKGDLTGSGNLNELAITTMSYNTNLLVTNIVNCIGNKTVFTYTNSLYPYLPTTREQYAANGTAVSTTSYFYYDVTNVPSLAFSNFVGSYGLLCRQVRAAGTSDAATNEWLHDWHGLPIQQISYTGTSDPNITNSYFYNLRNQLVENRDAAGRSHRYTYDGIGRPESHEIYDESGARVSGEYSYYNENGELTWSDGTRSNPEDYVWRDYDGAGRKVQEVRWRSQAKSDGTGVQAASDDALYATTFFEYDPFGNLIKTIDPRGNYQRMTYDAVGQLTEQRTYDGQTGQPLVVNRFAYEPGGGISRATNAIGGVTTNAYTTDGKLRLQRNPDGSLEQKTYYLDGHLQREYLANGNYFETIYDDANRMVKRLFSADASYLETQVLDRRGNVVITTNAVGSVFTTSYDKLDRVKQSSGPPASGGSAQQIASYAYDAAGKQVIVTNALGEYTITSFDALGRTTTNAVYNAQGVRVNISMIEYSSDFNSATATVGSGANAISTTIFTDTYGETVLTQKFPSGTPSISIDTYDLAGNLVTTKDELGKVTSYVYDGLNRLTSQTLPDGAAINFGYNAVGSMTNRIMPGGLTWSATFNSANQMLTEQLKGGATVNRVFTYLYYTTGPVGLLQTRTDVGRGVITAPSYDLFLRITNNAVTGSPAGTLGLNYQYDRRGLVTNISQTVGSTTQVIRRDYDAYGQIREEKVLLNGVLQSDFTENWNGAGWRSQLALVGGGAGSLINYGYRADGMMTNVNQAGTNCAFYYADNGLLTNRVNPWRTLAMNQRDGQGRLLQQTATVGGNNVFVETMAWRADSALNSYSATRSGNGAWNDNRNYQYNARNQLTNEPIGIANGKLATNIYAFDANKLGVLVGNQWSGGLTNSWQATALNSLGQITAESWNGSGLLLNANGRATNFDSASVILDGIWAGNATLSNGRWFADLILTAGTHTLAVAAYNPVGQFTATVTNTFTVIGTNSVTDYYDGSGYVTNRIFASGKTQAILWDGLGRLASVTQRDGATNGFNWTATYDGLGRRLQTINVPLTNGVTVGSQIQTNDSYFDPLVEFQELAVAVNGQRTWKMMGPDVNESYGGMQGAGGLEATVRESDGFIIPVLNDYWGNVLATVSATTVNWNSTRVSGYGPVNYLSPIFSSTASLADSLLWRSRRMDPSGFYNMGARYYDPIAGHFLSPDPYGHDSTLDLYSAFCGDPVNYFDPDGRCGIEAVRNAPKGQDTWDLYNQSSAFRELCAYVYPDAFTGVSSLGRNSTFSQRLGAIIVNWTISQGLSLPPQSFGSKARSFVAESVLNKSARDEAWNVLSHPDFSSGWGYAEYGVAGISYAANTVDAAANAIPVVGAVKGFAESTIKSGIKQITKIFVKDAAESLVKAETKKLVNESIIKELEGIVYKRTNPKTAEAYVGKAKSPERFAARQGEHDAALGVEHDFEVLGRAEPGTSLDVLEESMIRQHGGLQKEGGTLANKRHEMSEKRYRQAGGTVPNRNK